MSFISRSELMGKAKLLKSEVNEEPASVSKSLVETFPSYKLLRLLKAFFCSQSVRRKF